MNTMFTMLFGHPSETTATTAPATAQTKESNLSSSSKHKSRKEKHRSNYNKNINWEEKTNKQLGQKKKNKQTQMRDKQQG